ncbi:MAG: hypothetical protein ABJO75_02515 [Sedimentitalea sp.]|uniref:hypothetical protein n=1 Tax=Sedimentitalea sp. TaxID=2048915 RepID=UPI003265B606
MFSDVIDVPIALFIRAVNRVFRRRDYDLNLRPKCVHQTVCNALTVIFTIRQELIYTGINVGKQIRQCRFVAGMSYNQFRRSDRVSFWIKGDVECAPCFLGPSWWRAYLHASRSHHEFSDRFYPR